MFPASFTTCYFIAECLVNREAKGKRTKTGCYRTAANDYVSFFHTVNVCKALYFQFHLRVYSFDFHLYVVHSLERLGSSCCFGSLFISGLSRSANMRVIDHRAFIKYHDVHLTDPPLTERPAGDMVQGSPKCSMAY